MDTCLYIFPNPKITLQSRSDNRPPVFARLRVSRGRLENAENLTSAVSTGRVFFLVINSPTFKLTS